MSLIEVRNLSYIYSKETNCPKTAINNVNIDIYNNEIIGIIGHTGSGKSTLIQHFNGLLKPTSGDIYINGLNIWDNPKKIRDIRFKVGLVFQYPEYQIFEDTVYKDIAFGPCNMNLGPNEIQNRVIESINIVGLPFEILSKSPFELSGGEKRKVAIAGIIAMKPDVIVLDEPTAGLDPLSRKKFIENLKYYHSREKNTIIMVSHNMDDIVEISDKVLVMNNGSVEMFGRTRDIFSNSDALVKIGLDIPEITRIMLKLNNEGYKVKRDIFKLKDGAKEILNLFKFDEGLND